MGHEDMDVLQCLLQKPAEIIVQVRNLQQQFLNQMKAIVAERVEQDIGKCIRLLEQAVELTMPGITERGIDKYLVSMEEMKILLDLSEALGKGGREKEAGRLLQEGKWKVYEVAEKCGFSNYAYFYQLFKKETGISPTEWK